jgi:hypothetical protein
MLAAAGAWVTLREIFGCTASVGAYAAAGYLVRGGRWLAYLDLHTALTKAASAGLLYKYPVTVTVTVTVYCWAPMLRTARLACFCSARTSVVDTAAFTWLLHVGQPLYGDSSCGSI